MKKLSAIILTVLVCGAFFFAGCGVVNPEKPIGGDWRTWRGYTMDYEISDTLTVTFSHFSGEDESEGCNCYAVYDASCGARMGTIKVDAQNSRKMPESSGENFLTEDVDGDGMKDIGIPLDDGVLWYSLASPDRPQEGYPVYKMITPEK